MKRMLLASAAAALLTVCGANAAFADECSGHSHDTGTALGAAGGAAVGGLASHSVAGAVAGGVVGGFAGNAIARDQDCDAQRQAYEDGRARQAYQDDRASDAYNQGYADRADEDRQALNAPRPYDRPDNDLTVYREPGDPD